MFVFPVGMDTGVVQKEPASFMKHFAQEEQQRKVGRKQPMAGPQNISYYFPDIPEGMDLRDFVSCSVLHTHTHTHTHTPSFLLLRSLRKEWCRPRQHY